jgi:hypothetical protein
MKPDFENFTKELVKEFFEANCNDMDSGSLQSLLETHHIIKEVPASDEYKAEYDEDALVMFVPNFKECEPWQN